MKIKAWMIVKNNLSIKTCKNKPTCNPDEVLIQINIELPNDTFDTPRLSANLKVPKNAIKTSEINVEAIE